MPAEPHLAEVPEHLPGEPRHDPPRGVALLAGLLARALGVLLLLVATLPLWPVFLVGVALGGWPPNTVRLGQIARYLRLTASADPPAPGLPLGARLAIGLGVLRKLATVPWWGLCWMLDELLYGRALDATPLRAPLLEISAGRSGSTQLARYLEDDPYLVAPSLLQFSFPYLWMWWIAARLGRWITPDQVRRRLEAMLPPEFLERHEGDPFRTDTFDGALYLAHLNGMAPRLGPDAMIAEFHLGRAAPHNAALWERTFPDLLERIGRKTLVFAPPAPDGGPRRLFVKGHFLAAADALAARWPDARFLTMIRPPLPRLRSAINYLRVNPFDPLLGPVPWGWLARALAVTELEYGERELDWFTRPDGPRRCVIRFQDYVGDLEGTLARIYRELLETPALPAWAPRGHAPRARTTYAVDRSLAQAGIDETALRARLGPYEAWCRGEAPRARPASRE